MLRSLQVGDVAPDFSLPSSTGEVVQLHKLLEHSQVVLFFYPKAFTPLCTAEVCAFRDSSPQFTSRNATVIGISSDGPKTLERFAREHAISFPLLSDAGGKTRAAFGTPKLFGVLPGRVTYVIGQDRRIRQITVAAFSAVSHISESLNNLRKTTIER